MQEEVTTETLPGINFRITDDHLGEGGPKEKFARNIEAIETLFRLEAENRNATPEEQEILSRYVGWGGLADAFDSNKDNWAKEYAQLKALLPEQEYEMARASTLNAHYTSPTVIRAIYDALGQMGFKSGNILEPAMGIGNFFGMLPETMQDSRLYGVELDSITGRIAQKLYPEAEITVAGFETTDRRDFYDLAVGNVPFGNYKVSDKPYDRLGFSIHNYFFAKALDQVRPGGIVAFVTSRYTMDQQSQVPCAEGGASGGYPSAEQCFPCQCRDRCRVGYHLPAKAGSSYRYRTGLGTPRTNAGRTDTEQLFHRSPGDGSGAAYDREHSVRKRGMHGAPCFRSGALRTAERGSFPYPGQLHAAGDYGAGLRRRAGFDSGGSECEKLLLYGGLRRSLLPGELRYAAG